jgi:molecular chaperone DnaK
MAADNKLLGQFDLVGLPAAPRGVPQVEVTFDIDANGIVNVSAKDKATGKEQQIRIQASGGLSETDIQKMVKDAEANADADKKRKALVEARNHAEGLIHTTERSLKENEGKVPAADKQAAEQAIAALKTATAGEDAADIEAKTQALAQVSMKIGEALYKAQQPGDGGAQGPGGEGHGPSGQGPSGDSDAGKGSEKVVDADFEEVDENKGKKAS